METKRIRKEYYEQLCDNKLYNLDEMHEFLEDINHWKDTKKK